MASACTSSPSKMPVPRLPLEIVLTSKDGSTPRQLTCGSDRSCVTRAIPTNTLLDTPGESTCPPVALPLPPLPIGAIATRPATAGGAEDPQNTEPWSPQSLTGFSTPRNDLSLAKLTLASPRSGGSLQTPIGSPLLSPHSLNSPSMMSPMRLVGTRSSCSVKLSNGSTRLGRDGNIKCTSGGTPFTSPRNGTTTAAGGGGTSDGNNTTTIPRKPSVSRALPFTQPTPAAELSASQTKERFQIPHLNGRELSFSDLLDPNAKDRVHRMHTLGTTMPLSFVNAPIGGNANIPTLQQQPTPILTANANTKAHQASVGGRGGIPTSPTATGIANDGQATPRKRARKNVAPQRADFGTDDGCGVGSGCDTGSIDVDDSSHGETSGGHGNNNNARNNNADNGIASMTWEKEDVHTSRLIKNQYATSNRTNTRRNNNNNNNDIGQYVTSGSDASGACAVPAVDGRQSRGMNKRDHQ